MRVDKALNIVSFDVPFPPDYGGIIDVYYKLVWLKKNGVKIFLHCFEYGREPAEALEHLCEKVYYYPRKTGVSSNLSYLPYNVRSRQSEELEKNLLSNDFPILFEVLHTCYLLIDQRFQHRLKLFRHSNIEHVYYDHLARSEKSLLKKAYLKIEARKLERFEKVVANADHILAVNEEDAAYFTKNYKAPKTWFVPSFHANDDVVVSPGKGEYILYHGNLSVSENYEAADWLIDHVFSKIKHPVVIAGLRPPHFLREMAQAHKHISLVADPDEKTMNKLVSEAQVHALYTSQATGLKLKLLNVMFKGRFIVCNENMLRGTRFAENKTAGVFTGESGEQFISIINQLMHKSATEILFSERKQAVSFYSNEVNAKKISDLLLKK